MDVAVSPSGQVATASFDNAVGLWNGAEPQWLDGHAAAVTALSFVNQKVVVSGGDDFTLRRWVSGQKLLLGAVQGEVLGQHQAKIMSITPAPDGESVATASWDATIGLWSMSDPTDVQFLRGHKQGVNDVAFSPDGGWLYSASTDGTIRVWNTTTGETDRQLVEHGFGINELVLNAEESWIAYGAVDGGTRVIDIDTGNEIADFTLDRRPILAMAHHPGTDQLAVGDGEGYIMIIDTARMKISHDFRATRNGPVWALAFSKDGQNILAGGIEDILYSWPVEAMDEFGPMAGGTRSFLEDPSTLPNGERQFKRKCSICHALAEGSARKAGPTLYKLFGRPAGAVSDYSYSEALMQSDIVWSAQTMNDLFDQGPDHYIPGSKMPMQVIAGQQDRDDLIEYLRVSTDQEGD
ncbi:MAG: c-type cytochrome [Pseudomonadota bacterium]